MPEAAPVTTAVRPSSENASAMSGSTAVSCAFAAASRSPEMRSISDLDGGVRAVPARLELRHHLTREQLQVAHHLVVREVAELHVAEELVDPDRLIAQDLVEALVGGPDDDHVLFLVVLHRYLAVDDRFEQREDLLLLFLAELGQLPLEGELGKVPVPPVHGVPQPVGGGLVGV